MCYDSEMLQNWKLMCMFLTLFHTSACMKASNGADASSDLQLIHDKIDYRAIDKDVADAVLDKLNNHPWYLAEDIVLSLYSVNLYR